MSSSKSTNRKPRPIVQAWHTFAIAPAYFLILQLPEAGSDIIEKIFGHMVADRTLLKAATLFPFFCIASTLASSLTFAAVARPGQSFSLSSLRDLWHGVRPILPRLIPVSMLLGGVILLGFMALVLPGLYFMAAFLFVPQLLVSEPALPWSLYLSKSKKIAKKHFFFLFFVVSIFFCLNISAYMVSEAFENLAHSWVQNTSLVFGAALLFNLAVSCLTGAIVNLWTAYYFFHLMESPSA